MALGSYPSHRYSKAWMTQRLLNRAPEWTEARKNPASVAQQLINPIGLNLQETIQQLAQARYNMFLSTADLAQLDVLSYIDLTSGMEFSSTTLLTGEKKYSAPTVYATIGGTEYEITIAEKNNIETFGYNCLPSRIADGERSVDYEDVLSRTIVSALAAATPNDVPLEGHLYITLRDNDSWEERAKDKIYYPKVYIVGTTRKETSVTEVLPLRYNGTFKTINEWESVESISVSYLSSTAYLTVESFPFDKESYLDTRNINVSATEGEKMVFLSLNTHLWGSSLAYESFTLTNMDLMRTSGVDEKEIYAEVELLDEDENNITLNDFVLKPTSNFMFAVDDDNFYVYDLSLPYPDGRNAIGSPNNKVNLFSDKWIYTRDETATIKTKNLDVLDPPYAVRWTMLDPDGDEYYLGLDGSLWATTTDAWIANELWEESNWREQSIDLLLDKSGEYIITLESSYINERDESVTLSSKFLFFTPSIQPEVQLALPTALTSPEKIAIDSDNQIWIHKDSEVHLLDIFYDYFLVDYARNRVWLKETYSSVRVVV